MIVEFKFDPNAALLITALLITTVKYSVWDPALMLTCHFIILVTILSYSVLLVPVDLFRSES